MKLNWQDALSDIEFVDPGVLVVGKGLIPGIGDSGLEMKNTPAFPAQLQMTNNDQRIQLLMQQNMQSTFKMHSTLSMIIIWHPRLFVQNRGSLSSYAQMRPQQSTSSHLIHPLILNKEVECYHETDSCLILHHHFLESNRLLKLAYSFHHCHTFQSMYPL
jgi:hypothetical protein